MPLHHFGGAGAFWALKATSQAFSLDFFLCVLYCIELFFSFLV
jgi:hypothetical protein